MRYRGGEIVRKGYGEIVTARYLCKTGLYSGSSRARKIYRDTKERERKRERSGENDREEEDSERDIYSYVDI